MTRGAGRTAASLLGLVIGMMLFLHGQEHCRALAEQPAKVLVFPFHLTPGKHDEELRSFGEHANARLRSGIGLLKETCILESVQATEELLQGKNAPESDEEARNLAAKSGADLVVYGYLAEGPGGFSMKAVMWDLRVDRRALATELTVGNVHGLPQILEFFVSAIGSRLHAGPGLPFYATQSPLSAAPGRPSLPALRVDPARRAGPWRSPELAAEVWAVAVGDLDGDGGNETVLLEDGVLNISRFDNGNLVPLVQYSRAPQRFFSAEVQEAANGGIAHLIVSSLSPAGIESSIIRYEKRDFKVAHRLPNVILKSIQEPDEGMGRILVGQRTDVKDMFTGEMLRYEVRDNELVQSGTVALPAGTLLLSYAAGKMGKNGEFLRVILNQDQRLMAFDAENRLLYTTADRIYGLDRSLRIPEGPRGRDIVCPGRILIADTDGDGENELLVIKQTGDTSMINALTWDGEKLVEKWKTIGTRGIISDFTIGDLRNEGTRSLVLSLVAPAPFPGLTRSRSVVYAYDLIP
jgi:hypothetical protein